MVLPFLLLWLVSRVGYDRRAWMAQTLVAWVVLPVCYCCTKPSDNINWVFGPGQQPQTWMAPRLYLALLMVFFPLCVYVPTHLVLQALILFSIAANFLNAIRLRIPGLGQAPSAPAPAAVGAALMTEAAVAPPQEGTTTT